MTIFKLQTQCRALIRKLDIKEETKELAYLHFEVLLVWDMHNSTIILLLF